MSNLKEKEKEKRSDLYKIVKIILEWKLVGKSFLRGLSFFVIWMIEIIYLLILMYFMYGKVICCF